MDRRTEIVNAAHEALRITVNWIADVPKTESMVLTPMVITALEGMVLSTEGDVPESCQDLYLSIRKFAEELYQYKRGFDGKVNANGSPVPSFWAALSEVEKAAAKSDTVYIQQLESVQDLRQQGVSDEQIAAHIYGLRGEGPFMTQHKTINKRLLDQAAKGIEQQDELLKLAGWPEQDGVFYPPWTVSANDGRKKMIQQRLEVFKALEAGPQRYEDPESIEDMIMAGCFVQQIMMGKHCDRNTVLEAAMNLGVEVKDAPGYKPSVPLPKSQTAIPTTDAVAAQSQVSPVSQDEIMASMKSKPDELGEHDRMAIESILSGNPSHGPAEVIADLAEDKIIVTAKQVAKVMKEMKAAAKAAAR